MIGIYAIIFKHPKTISKAYIGSSINIENRWKKHKSNLNNNKQLPNKFLQDYWNYYGELFFHFIVLQKCEKDTLLIQEQKWIELFKNSEYEINNEMCFNVRPFAKNMLGFKHSDETKLKISKSLLGNTYGAGERNHNSKLTDEQVLSIKHLLNTSELYYFEIAQQFNISVKVIQTIASNKSWTTVGEKVKPMPRPHKTLYGEQQGKAKLTNKEVVEIKGLLNNTNISYKELSKQFNVSIGCLENIAYNRTWRTIGGKVTRQTNSKRRFSSEEVKEIREKAKNGETYVSLSKIYNISSAAISKIVNYKTYKNVF